MMRGIKMQNYPPQTEEDGCYLTISLLIEHERLEQGDWGNLVNSNLKRLSKSLYGTSDDWCNNRLVIESAIRPMFDDIADLNRQVFLDEYLINPPANNKSALTVKIPQVIHWSTEGAACEAKFREEMQWNDVRVRSFFAKHSNGDLSYHLSLKIKYEHTLQHYYGLSVLQKILFISEEKTMGQRFNLLVSDNRETKDYELQGFIRTRFAEDFFSTFLSDNLNTTSFLDEDKTSSLWNSLIKDSRQHDSNEIWPPKFFRALFILKDPLFHRALTDRESLIKGMTSTPFANLMRVGERTGVSTTGNQPHSTSIIFNFHEAVKSEGHLCDELAFLSGFLQNVIDFLRQDEAEFLDGTDPLFKDNYFLIFATQEATFEIVQKSRSLKIQTSSIMDRQ
jgi:hypothetical protein